MAAQRDRGRLAAATLFVLPGAVALLLLSAVYVAYGTTTVVASLFAGLAPAVLAIVAQAVVRVGKKALHRPVMVALAVAAFFGADVLRGAVPSRGSSPRPGSRGRYWAGGDRTPSPSPPGPVPARPRMGRRR